MRCSLILLNASFTLYAMICNRYADVYDFKQGLKELHQEEIRLNKTQLLRKIEFQHGKWCTKEMLLFNALPKDSPIELHMPKCCLKAECATLFHFYTKWTLQDKCGTKGNGYASSVVASTYVKLTVCPVIRV